MTASTLTGKARRALRARAHGINPAVTIGVAGVSDAVLAETDRALDDHELVKVRIVHEDREVRRHCVGVLCEKLDAQHIQSLGKTALIYREHDNAHCSGKA